MKVLPMDLGVCGVEQLMYAGSIAFDTENASEGVTLLTLPENTIITKAVAVVKTAFNATTTNTITIGTDTSVSNLLGSSDITGGTTGAYIKNAFVESKTAVEVKAKYTQAGTAATAGKAEIYLFVVRIPE